MIRFSDILLEYEDSHEEMMNVLFIVDDESLTRSGFIRHIISQRVVVGDINSADKQNTEALKDLVLTNAEPELDLIVVVSRGIYDDDPVDVIRNFEIIQQYTDTIDVPVLYFTLPTIRFIKDKKDISNNWTEIERLKVNNILRNKFNDVVDLSNFDQDEYFKKDGKTYNLNAHLTLYKLLFRKIRNYDPTAKVKTRITDISCDITKIQKKLLSLNFDINTSEIAKSQYGPSTRAAVNIIRKKLGYTPSEELTKNLCNAIMLLDPQDNIISIIDKRKKCPNPRPKARLKYDPKNYDGINGIKSKLSLGTFNGVVLNLAAGEQYNKMLKAMPANIQDKLTRVGGFRSYESQYNIVDWDLYECYGIWRKIGSNGTVQVAEPGTSNHGIGMAIDVHGSAAQNWIKQNGEKYGWWWAGGTFRLIENWHFEFDAEKIDISAQQEAEKGTIEKTIDVGLQSIPKVGTYLKIAKDWFMH